MPPVVFRSSRTQAESGVSERPNAVHAGRGAEVHVLHRGPIAQLRRTQVALQGAVPSPVPLLIDQQGEALLKAQPSWKDRVARENS